MADTALDPFRIALGIIAAENDSDALLLTTTAAGLKFDTELPADASISHKTRVRALVPRILTAYDLLPTDSGLAAARSLIARLTHTDARLSALTISALERAGWQLEGDELRVASPDLRELFFPAGSQWDAFVVIRDLFLEATANIMIVDAYADGKVFSLLQARHTGPLHVRILCSRYAQAVAAEATAFSTQRSEITFEVRTTRDFHDRFIVLDGATCVHVGASLNSAGRTGFMISRVEDAGNRVSLLTVLDASWLAGTPVV